MTTEVRGLKELGDKLKMLAADVQKTAVRKSTAKGIEVFRREIRATAPRRVLVGVTGFRKSEKAMMRGRTREPGFLRAHIGRWLKKNPDGSFSGFTGPTRSAFYGRFYEMGTKHQPPRPWMRPTFTAKTEEAKNAFAAEMKNWLGELVK